MGFAIPRVLKPEYQPQGNPSEESAHVPPVINHDPGVVQLLHAAGEICRKKLPDQNQVIQAKVAIRREMQLPTNIASGLFCWSMGAEHKEYGQE